MRKLHHSFMSVSRRSFVSAAGAGAVRGCAEATTMPDPDISLHVPRVEPGREAPHRRIRHWR
ncbi:MAG: hypothetical protein ACK2UO_07880, partial [Caldilineaceae bacterium]